MARLLRYTATLGALAAAPLAYGTLIERNAFTLRRFQVPVLAPGSPPIRVLHISDLHVTPNQSRKLAFVSDLARLAPDLVINTGDTMAHAHAIPAIMRGLRPLFDFPGAFVPGNNDYYAPTARNPLRYFKGAKPAKSRPGTPLPWASLATAMTNAGWTDLTDRRALLNVANLPIALAGTDDPHLGRARYHKIAGPADPSAAVRLGLIHSPEPWLFNKFTEDGYDLVLAGHTHGGQVRIPFGPALVTNCGINRRRARWLHQWDDRMWFHICAGLGTGPYTPIRFACRPEASLLTLVARPG
jgi:predicted MPP superfamily phosphohydrolase